MKAAAVAQGEARAQVVIPALPDRCRQHMGRIVPKLGEKTRWTQKRWEFAADAVDRQIDDCAAFHDDLKTNLEKL